MKRALRRFFGKWYVITTIVIVAAIAVYAVTRGPAAPSFESAVAAIGNVDEQVSVTGTVMPLSKADLAFEKSGVVTAIKVAIGDSVKAGDVIATLDDATDLANLQSAQAKLDDISRGLLPQELSSDQAQVLSAETALANAKVDAINAAHTSYAQALSAILNSADAVFSNPSSANPTIAIRTQSSTEQYAIDAERLSVTTTLSDWKADI
ncbi:MAG: biotin/lipoyl-binding protein, partial [Patescibacteria group bacterium]|nr:biotin/lipoyl-binding protein [Patescibacteria group bacterium]